MNIKNLFRDNWQYRVFGLLTLSTLFCFALIAVRLQAQGFYFEEIQTTEDLWGLKSTATFLFLIWNLFLAWIPYWIALALEPLSKKFRSSWISAIAILTWLFFFPNAPYILTDLLHLKVRHPIPHWYDLMLIVSFAWTGLLLGYLSLYEVQRFIQQRKNSFWAWSFSIGATFLCGLGIYLGRYLRWNSWDILSHPFHILEDAWQSMLDPTGQTGEGIIWVSSIFLFLGYLTVVTLVGGEQSAKNND